MFLSDSVAKMKSNKLLTYKIVNFFTPLILSYVKHITHTHILTCASSITTHTHTYTHTIPSVIKGY